VAEPLPPEAGRWLLTLSGGYPDGIWCCSACMAPLTEGVITHEDGCPDSAPAIRAAERARISAGVPDLIERYRSDLVFTAPELWPMRLEQLTERLADLIGGEPT